MEITSELFNKHLWREIKRHPDDTKYDTNYLLFERWEPHRGVYEYRVQIFQIKRNQIHYPVAGPFPDYHYLVTMV